MASLPTSLRLPILRRLATEGDAQARLEWGLSLCFGSGDVADEAEGRRRIEEAAAAGLPRALRCLARRVREDRIPSADAREARARALEARAARAGCPQAMRDVALWEIEEVADPAVSRRVRRRLLRSLAAGNGRAGYDLAMRVVTLRGDLHEVERLLRRARTVDELERASEWMLAFLGEAKPPLRRFAAHAPDLWRAWAEAGDPDAQTVLGYAHRFGRAVPYAPKEAARLWRKAADGGHADACVALLLLRADDEVDPEFEDLVRWAPRAAATGRPVALWAAAGVVEDDSETESAVATAWLLAGAERRDPRCAHAYANVLLRRPTASRTRRRELRFRRLAARGGFPPAQVYLAEMFANGEGTRAGARDAVRCLRPAAARGDPAAQNRLGVHLHEGHGIRRDDTAAVRWYRRAAAAGNAHAVNNLGLCLKNGHGVRKDTRKATTALQRAVVVFENPGSAGRLGEAHASGWAGARDPALAARWWRRGAALGDPTSLRRLGVAHHEGDGVERDLAFAALLYRAAAALGDAWAAYCMGLCRRDGDGVGRNARRARVWFGRALRLSRASGDRRTASHARRAIAPARTSAWRTDTRRATRGGRGTSRRGRRRVGEGR